MGGNALKFIVCKCTWMKLLYSEHVPGAVQYMLIDVPAIDICQQFLICWISIDVCWNLH